MTEARLVIALLDIIVWLFWFSFFKLLAYVSVSFTSFLLACWLAIDRWYGIVLMGDWEEKAEERGADEGEEGVELREKKLTPSERHDDRFIWIDLEKW